MATRLMTYAELAETWGVSKEAARKKVEGLGLPRQMGNDGRARVMVDLMEVQHEPTKPRTTGRRAPGDRPETGPESSDLKRLVSTLEATVARLEALDTTTRADLDRERSRADALASDLAIRAKLEIVQGERDAEKARAGQIEVLNAVLDIERQRLAEARQEAEQWRQAATAPRGLLAWFRRL